jgi:hypothetical protein
MKNFTFTKFENSKLPELPDIEDKLDQFFENSSCIYSKQVNNLCEDSNNPNLESLRTHIAGCKICQDEFNARVQFYNSLKNKIPLPSKNLELNNSLSSEISEMFLELSLVDESVTDANIRKALKYSNDLWKAFVRPQTLILFSITGIIVYFIK